jgi:hypothetical protein
MDYRNAGVWSIDRPANVDAPADLLAAGAPTAAVAD